MDEERAIISMELFKKICFVSGLVGSIAIAVHSIKESENKKNIEQFEKFKSELLPTTSKIYEVNSAGDTLNSRVDTTGYYARVGQLDSLKLNLK